MQEAEAVTNFRNYLRIRSVQPDIDYTECVRFLKSQAESMGLPVYTVDVGKPIVIMKYPGKDPSLPTVLLNSHMDVVPVYPEMWKYPPFEAIKDESGNIYARGAQDMKCIGIQYLEAIRRYVHEGLITKRTIYLTFMPDEEIDDGMRKFVQTEEFDRLNVGIALDEGLCSADDTYNIYYAERSAFSLDVICTGRSGHGSVLHEDTAAEKLRYVIDKFMDLRESEKLKLTEPGVSLGDVISVNMTKLSGGIQANVVPNEMTVTFDIRLPIHTNVSELSSIINRWCCEAGNGQNDVHVRHYYKLGKFAVTSTDDTNPWWSAFESEMNKMGLKFRKSVFPGGTDIKYIRSRGISAFGFHPVINTKPLLHDHNEFLNEDEFRHGIDIYYNLIRRLASV